MHFLHVHKNANLYNEVSKILKRWKKVKPKFHFFSISYDPLKILKIYLKKYGVNFREIALHQQEK